MSKANKKVAFVIKKVAKTMANFSCGAASAWGLYQPKEPKKLNTPKK